MRPKDWVEISNKAVVKLKKQGIDFNPACFIAGADAYEEALKKEGIYTYGNHTPDIDLSDAPVVSGYWCFIPEEEGNGKG